MTATCPTCGFSPIEPETTKCPKCRAAVHRPNPDDVRTTRLETPEDMRRWSAAAASKSKPKAPPRAKSRPEAPSAAATADAAQPFRPRVRPPLLLLCIVDEGQDGGEWRRLRADHTVIGRAEGDIVIPHDSGISARHAELRRVTYQGRFRWVLRDLKSTNGTFVRAAAAPLDDHQEFIVGATRFRLELTPKAATGDDLRSTNQWQAATNEPVAAAPALIELHSKGPGTPHPLAQKEVWIGSDASCQIVLAGDPFVSGRHARLRNRNDRWELENHQSLNGTWLRINEIPIDSTAEFQLGEQRFLVKVC
ncbi:MAG TPA: FHA domain-containing protein [Pirellulales bacterium]|nr:FHA domain-containing protein [Pirellulales bacterium]